MAFTVYNKAIVAQQTIATNFTQIIDMTGLDSIAIQPIYTDGTPGAKGFVAANVNINPANSITITNHGFVTGLKVELTGTNLPGGLSTTNYWVVKVDANTIKLATSLANAVAGTVVTISSQGTTADATLTPATLASGGYTLKLQYGNDSLNWTDVSGDTVTITAAGNQVWTFTNPAFSKIRIVGTANTGAISFQVYACAERLYLSK